MELPTRPAALAAGTGYAALGGALVGSAEAARIVVGGGLLLGDGAVVALLVAGALGGALLSAVVVAPLGLLPPRPLGRVRWSGFLGGVWAQLAAQLGVVWYTDPPPYTDPFRFQGNTPVFLGILVVLGIAAGLLYQGARGVRPVSITALLIAVACGAWVETGLRTLPEPTKAMPAGAPNVLLVTLDTSRADMYGAYGNDTVDTRAFDSVAKDGALFLDAAAVAPVTGPSHTSILMGAGPWDHGVLLNGVPLPDRPLLAEILHDHGYSTAAFVSAWVLDGKLGFRRGFEVYDDDFGWFRGASGLLPARILAMARRHADPDEVLQRRGADTVDQALTWLNSREGGGAWFLWVHLFDAHGPYEPPPPWNTQYYQGDPTDPSNPSMKQVTGVAPYLARSLKGITDVKYVIAQYEGEVSYADTQLARLLSAIDAKNTLVVVSGDHGESLGEHGVWFNHGDDVYETSVHVPFAMRWPGRIPAGTRVEQPVEGSDLTPTVLELLGIDRPESMTGRSAVPALSGGAGRSMARSLTFDRAANREARAAGQITKPKYRIAGLRGPASDLTLRETASAPEYFDLKADPSGLTDVRSSVEGTPEGKELLGILESEARSLFGESATRRSGDAETSSEDQERLRALGYMEP